MQSYSFLLYNIRYGTGSGWSYHLPLPLSGFFRRTDIKIGRIKRFLKPIDPDIIGLVEVDDGSYRSRSISQVEQLAAELNYTALYNSKYGEQSFVQKLPIISKQGNAFFVRPAVQNYQYHFLKNGFKRLAIEVEFKDFCIFLVHLALSQKIRRQQLQDLSEILLGTNKSVIVAGDFNVFKGYQELHEFLGQAGLIVAGNEKKYTYPSKNPRYSVDLFLHSPEIKLKKHTIFQNILYSDHLPVLCEFDI